MSASVPIQRKRMKLAGTKRELKEVQLRKDQGYVAFRTPASMGVCDVIAMRAYGVTPDESDAVWEWMQTPRHAEVLFIEVKANVGSPWMHFRKPERDLLRLAAKAAGATALLVHWPPRGERREYPESEWPDREPTEAREDG